ncbi:hypothetical protein SSBR45G_28200 [Bradyrhizobium sp. SSBR45G]|nr:hypothetical protein SSBR45G_28200 [Bradyrhizobium sp. SSBR45G]GLH85467.1 hypothetical protein SSBR45R_29270 [Bradyrhizobium sp. SSBR45R]
MPDCAETPTDEETLFHGNKLLADIPCVTIVLVVALLLIFALERRLALDIGPDGSLDLRSLIAYGGSSYDLVVGRREWWRIGLAPLLHGSEGHLIGNCIALFIVGIRLEWLVGRGWLTLIFFVSALAGAVGSLLGNPHGVVSVGASGAITGLIAALFIASFDPQAESTQMISRLKMSLFFGVPALLPLALGASGNTDYYAHAGGALAGLALAVLPWVVFWSYDSLPRIAGKTLAVASVCSLVCAGFAASRYASYMADAAHYIRASEMPVTAEQIVRRSADLVSRYPRDPRGHLFHAISLIEQRRFAIAETEARAAMTLAASDVAGGPVRSGASALMAMILLVQGRESEAKVMAAESCDTKVSEVRRMLKKTKLCA